jgi:hypothetical protein
LAPGPWRIGRGRRGNDSENSSRARSALGRTVENRTCGYFGAWTERLLGPTKPVGRRYCVGIQECQQTAACLGGSDVPRHAAGTRWAM